jgi:RHS repeat-associated protein
MTQKNATTHVFARLNMILCVLLCLAGTSQGDLKAQSNITLQGKEATSVIDGVDVFSGQLEQILPLISVSGRGDVGNGLYLPVRNSQWTVIETASSINNDKVFKTYVAGQGAAGSHLTRAGYATLGKLELEVMNTSPAFIGFQMVTGVKFTSNKGTVTHFRDVQTNGEPFDPAARGCMINGPLQDPLPACSRGKVFRATDGSSGTLVFDNDIYDAFIGEWGSFATQNLNSLASILYLSDGSIVRFGGFLNSITKVTDRNGNTMTFDYETAVNSHTGLLKKITDPLNREIHIVYGDQTQSSYFDDIVYKGFAEAERRVRIHYAPVETVMVPGQSLGIALFPGVHERCYLINGSGTCPIPGGQPGAHFATSVKVLSAVALPNGQEYRFYYNNYLEVARIKNPSGAYADYSFGGLTGAGTDGFTEPLHSGGGTIYRRITAVKNFEESGQLISEKTFSNIPGELVSPPNVLDSVVIDVKSSSGTVLSKTKRYFHGSGLGPIELFPSMRHGKEYQTEILDPVSQAVLRRTEITWKQRQPFQWCSTNIFNNVYPCDTSADPDAGPPVDPGIAETKATLDNGQVMKRTFTQDQYNNITDVYDYDWGNGQAGALLRRTHTDYVTDPNYTNHANGRILLRLPLHTWVSSDLDGSSKTSFTSYEYDNYNSVANHAPLVSRSNVSGYDTNYHTGFTIRGNTTAVTRFEDAQAQTGPIVAYSQYDVLGNVVKAIDAKGFISSFDYADHFGTPNGEAHNNWDTVAMPAQLNGKSTFAFLTSVTNPANHVTATQYDYCTGLAVDVEDINGNVSSSFYADPLDRPTQLIIANNRPTFRSQKTIVYDDANRKVTTTSDLFAFGDNLTKTETVNNSLGQTTESRVFEGGGEILLKREYDTMGRLSKESNPYRPYLAETPTWTITEYDSQGRVTKVKTPDNSEAITLYEGNATTFTDQGGRKRRGLRNSLDQLTRIDEPNSLNELGAVETPTQPTFYTYNANGQLVKVTQGSQNRFFLFDSVGRLKRVSQPEQVANANLFLPDPITANNHWTMGSTYDPNGNVQTITDARGITTTQTFDALNRVLTMSYSDSTPTVTYFYDDPSINFSKGQPTKVSSSISVTEHTAFDPLGRILAHRQTTDGQVYTTGYTYTLSGELFEETYPSGRIVRSTMDNDAKLTEVSSKKVDQASFQSHANSFAYTSHGEVSRLRLGNGTWESIEFNVRLQPSQVALGTTAGATEIFKASYEFGDLDAGGNLLANRNNGNVARQTISVPGLSQPFVQTYKYDAVNRLKEAKEMNGATQTWIQTIDYDRYGNRTSFNQQKVGEQQINNTPAVSTLSNRITTGQGFVYDSNGNLVQDDLGRQFTFDGNNRQKEVKDAGNNVIGSYLYDGSGRRVKKISTFETVVFVYDAGGRLVAEYSNQIAANPGLSYLITDNLGTPRVITDAAGNVVTRRDFMPFGEELPAGNANRTATNKYGSGADDLRQRFTGYEKDSETELDFAEARYYDNRYGRFTAVDPMLASGQSSNPQTFNRYAYVQNNPVVLTDPTGMYSGSHWSSSAFASLLGFSQDPDKLGPPPAPPKLKKQFDLNSIDILSVPKGEGALVKVIELGIADSAVDNAWDFSNSLLGANRYSFKPFITCAACLNVRTPDAVRISGNFWIFQGTITYDGYGDLYLSLPPFNLASGDLNAPKAGTTIATKLKQIIGSALKPSWPPIGGSAEMVFVTASGGESATEEQTRAAFGGNSLSVQGGYLVGGSIDLGDDLKPTAVGMGITTARFSIAGGTKPIHLTGGYSWRHFVPWFRRTFGFKPPNW